MSPVRLRGPWDLDAGCGSGCAAHAVPRVTAAEAARRGAALAYVLAQGLSLGERLAEPHTLRAQARSVLAALGIRLRAGGGPLGASGAGTGTLIVANHISWLDVIALLAVEPVPLLAKREVAQWPLIGTLARRAGTRFLDRAAPRELPHAVRDLADTLRSGRSVVVFPQATTWCSADGGTFRRATFQAAVDAGAPVRPVTVSYEQRGRPSTVAAFLGDEGFAASLRRVLTAGELTVRVTVREPLRGGDRRSLAAEAQARVGARGMGRSPEDVHPAAHTGPHAMS